MRAYRGFVLMVTALGLADDAAAQFRVLPPAPAVAPRDVFFHPRRGRVVVSGFFGDGFFGPPVVFAPPPGFVYGVIEPRFSVHVYVPPRFLAPAVDLSGVDLDAEPPPWVREGELPRRGVPAVVQPRQQPEQVAKIEPPKKEVAPPVVPPVVPPVLAPEKPKLPGQAAEANLVLGSRQLTALGVAAFQDKDYGLAAQRFQQALDADAAAARPHFLLGQAYVALGKFREAVQIIGVGLAKDPTWPRSDFRPRVDLYMNQDDWNRHVALLEQVQAGQPQNAGYLFLLAYVRWFDDDRAAATRLFREVRPLVGDPGLVDLFLKKS